MEHEQDIFNPIFNKETIAKRFGLPVECVNLLIDEFGMPYEDEEAFVKWGLKNFNILWQQIKTNGPIAQMEKASPRPSTSGSLQGISANTSRSA